MPINLKRCIRYAIHVCDLGLDHNYKSQQMLHHIKCNPHDTHTTTSSYVYAINKVTKDMPTMVATAKVYQGTIHTSTKEHVIDTTSNKVLTSPPDPE